MYPAPFKLDQTWFGKCESVDRWIQCAEAQKPVAVVFWPDGDGGEGEGRREGMGHGGRAGSGGERMADMWKEERGMGEEGGGIRDGLIGGLPTVL